MRAFETNHQRKDAIAHRYLHGFSILTLALMFASGSVLLAQSGRNQSQAEPASPKSPQAEKDDKKEVVTLPAFIVVTSAPDKSEDNPYRASYSQSINFEYLARGGCLLELRSIPGAKVSEDEDVARWEARETALAEDKAWVIWMQLRWDKTSTTFDSTPFRLRYLLFEPRTGRIAASGVGKGVRQTWGRPQTRSTSLEEQLREAGRDIADQVVSELKSRQ